MDSSRLAFNDPTFTHYWFAREWKNDAIYVCYHVDRSISKLTISIQLMLNCILQLQSLPSKKNHERLSVKDCHVWPQCFQVEGT